MSSRTNDAEENLERLHAFCKDLPKIELHAHLNGSIRQHTLVELANERGVKLPAEFLLHEAEHHDADKEALFFNTKPRSLKECFDIFAIIPKCVNDLVALRRITHEVLQDCARDNVAYVELRTGPKVLLRNHRAADGLKASKRDYVEIILMIMEEFEKKEQECYQLDLASEEATRESVRLPLIPRLIISVDRSGTLEQAKDNVDLAIELFKSGHKYVVGVELGGNPTQNDFRMFQPLFEAARTAGLSIGIHCGEVPMGSNEAEKDPALRKAFEEGAAVIQFKPNRLGHALLLSDSLIDKLMQQSPIHIECCPTSNVMTLELALHHGGSLIDGLKMHPQLGKWLKNKYPISINTDDSGLFCTNLTKEYLLVAKAYGLSSSELSDINLKSVDHIFDPRDEIRSNLRTEIQRKTEFLMSPDL